MTALQSNTVHKAIVRRGRWCAVESRPDRPPGPGELAVAPEKVSLCGTDIQILRGDRDDPSDIVGHEGAARVVGVGAGVDGFRIGDRVVINPTHPDDSSFLLGHNVEGLFQERVVIAASAVSGGLVSLLPDELSASRATLVEPFAVVRYALAALAAATPDTLIIHGDGLIGNLAAFLAPHFLLPSGQVVVVHRSSEGMEWTGRHAPAGTRSALDTDPTLYDGVGDAVAVLVATHRGGTIPAIEGAVRGLGARLRAVHPVGGLAPDARTPLLPGVDLPAVRAANTGGPWPPSTVTFAQRDRRIVCSGNRGVTNTQLVAAAGELVDWGGSIDALLTHEVSVEEAPRDLDAICAGRSRIVDGELVMRLVVDFGAR